ncbi:hypothetical protein MA16_Dca025861 [Dendrobium catenatum]|uniref:Complex 1 LYR protein domain-containing protein n=1 Tax=Dendrobium catenatum TaxID=906689 RepID=A0A2I0VD37_9ASPA|nr:hypothetical protein MA16_Dca025861 [Dendrobium catenatum]
MASPWKLSGMQRQVLALYRCFLRAARLKNLEDRQRIVSVVSAEFHHNANNVDRKNFQYIEYLLRRGKRQLEQLKNSTTISLSTINLNSSASKTITEDKKLASTAASVLRMTSMLRVTFKRRAQQAKSAQSSYYENCFA